MTAMHVILRYRNATANGNVMAEEGLGIEHCAYQLSQVDVGLASALRTVFYSQSFLSHDIPVDVGVTVSYCACSTPATNERLALRGSHSLPTLPLLVYAAIKGIGF